MSDLAGNTFETAFDLGVLIDTPKIYNEWVGDIDSSDFYKFNILKKSSISAILNGITGVILLRLYDEKDDLLFTSNYIASKPEVINVNLDPGIYYLKAEAIPFYPPGTYYSLNVSASAIPDYSRIFEDKAGEFSTQKVLDKSRAITLSEKPQIFEDWISSLTDSNDDYQFTLTNTSLVRGSIIDSNIAYSISIFSVDTGKLIYKTDSLQAGETNYVSMFGILPFEASLEKGAYYLRISPYGSGDQASYKLNIAAVGISDQAGQFNNIGVGGYRSKKIVLSDAAQVINDWIGSGADEYDDYNFQLSNSSFVKLAFNSYNTENAKFTILDSQGNIIPGYYYMNQNLGQNEFDRNFTAQVALNAGSYYLRVRPNLPVIYYSNPQTSYSIIILASTIGPENSDTPKNTLGLYHSQSISLNSKSQVFHDWIGSVYSTDNTNSYGMYNDYLFVIPEKTFIQATLNRNNDSALFFLLDENGKVVDKFGDGNQEYTRSNTLDKLLEPGKYTIRIKQFGARQTEYTLSIAGFSRTPTIKENNDDSLVKATNIPFSTVPTTFISSVGDYDKNDFYRFNLDNNSLVRLSIHGIGDRSSAFYQLLDKDGKSLSSNFGSQEFSLGTGNYYVKVSGGSSGNHTYTLEASSSIVRDNAGSDISTARNIDVNTTPTTYSDWIGNTDITDLYKFNLKEDSFFQASIYGVSEPVKMFILDNTGQIIQTTTGVVSTSGRSQTFYLPLLQGLYYIEISSYNNTEYVGYYFKNTQYDLVTFANPINSLLPQQINGIKVLPKEQLISLLNQDATSMSKVLEFVSKDLAYRDNWKIGDKVTQYYTGSLKLPSGLSILETYTVSKIIKNEKTGLYAIGLTSPDSDPILAFRGTQTSGSQDFISDLDPNGIGYGQFTASLKEIRDWLTSTSSKPIITGHSLGGALSQWAAADFTGNLKKDLGALITFNSPGISPYAYGQGSRIFDKAKADRVIHYITSGDIVSLSGSEYAGGSYTLSSYQSGFALLNALNAHLEPVLVDLVRYGTDGAGNSKNVLSSSSTNLPVSPTNEIFILEFPFKKDYFSENLNSPFFGYGIPTEFDNGYLKTLINFVSLVGLVNPLVATVSKYINISSFLASGLLHRGGTELLRRTAGELVSSGISLANFSLELATEIQKRGEQLSAGFSQAGKMLSETAQGVSNAVGNGIGKFVDTISKTTDGTITFTSFLYNSTLEKLLPVKRNSDYSLLSLGKMALLNEQQQNNLLSTASQIAKQKLSIFFSRPDYTSQLQVAFGETFTSANATTFLSTWKNPNTGFSNFPTIKILPLAQLAGSIAVYSIVDRTVFISKELLESNSNNPEVIANVLLEEIGHYIAANIASSEPLGDEGEIFSALVQNKVLTAAELDRMRSDDDLFALGIVNTNFDYSTKPVIRNFWDSIGQWNATAWESAATWNTTVWTNASTWTPETWESVSQWSDATWTASKTWTPETWSAPFASLLDVKITEGNIGRKTLEFKITLSKASDRKIQFKYSSIDGTAIAGQDYLAVNATLIFNPGETLKSIKVEILADTLIEKDETFTLKINQAIALPKDSTQTETAINLAKNIATATIQNDDVRTRFTRPRNDFYGINQGAIVYHNQSTGQLAFGMLDATNTPRLTYLTATLDKFWELKGTADFNGDGKADMLWQNSQTGNVNLWIMNGTAILENRSIALVTDATKKKLVIAIDDFDGDGKADILWKDSTPNVTDSTTRYYVQLTGGSITLVDRKSSNWNFLTTGDFNGDGKADLLFDDGVVLRNGIASSAEMWLMNGSQRSAQTVLPKIPRRSNDPMVFDGVGDFDQDGKTDISWYNPASGKITLWKMDGAKIVNSQPIVNLGVFDRGLKSYMDFTGDGKSDLLEFNPVRQSVSLAKMDRLTPNQAPLIFVTQLEGGNASDPKWTAERANDYNGDGIADLVLKQANTGSTKIWLFNPAGLSPTDSPLPRSIALNQFTDPNWKLIA